MQKQLGILSGYFSKGEKILWFGSMGLIVLAFLIFDRGNYLTLCASLVGVTSLIYDAKGNPFGQFLMVLFSFLYGVISYRFAYYGEMITYLGMTAPMSMFALISWIKNSYSENRAEVEVVKLKEKEIILMFLFSGIVTGIFYFILGLFHTTNLIFSTVSVTTSFLAVYLTYKRSVYFALAYAANDIVLIILWVLAALADHSYWSVVTCFLLFFINDIYTFISWVRMYQRQKAERCVKQ